MGSVPRHAPGRQIGYVKEASIWQLVEDDSEVCCTRSIFGRKIVMTRRDAKIGRKDREGFGGVRQQSQEGKR